MSSSKQMGFGCFLFGSLQGHNAISNILRDRDNVRRIFARRFVPPMGHEHTINVALASDLNIVPCLDDVNTIVVLVEAIIGFNSHTGEFAANMFTQEFNETFGSSECKLITKEAFGVQFVCNQKD